MFKSSLAYTLLTLFTSAERAATIEGDLIEQARSRGQRWFWWQVVRTTSALCWSRFVEAPIATFGWTLAGFAGWFVAVYAVAFLIVIPLEWLLLTIGLPPFPEGVALSPIFPAGGLLTGVLLGRLGNARGICAAVAVSVALIVLGTGLAPGPTSSGHIFWPLQVVSTTALLVAGSILGRRWAARRTAARG